jgi:nucleotide-binding universal stress UspA family protein
MAGGYADDEAIDEASRRTAFTTATAGADRATATGLLARPRCTARRGGVANTILAAAAEEDADVIVLGTRGLSGVKSFLLGSVSHAVTQHADRSVLVTPSPSVAARRREWAGLEAVPV